MTLASVLLALFSANAQAAPDWVGTKCMEFNHRGERVPMELQLCKDLYPTHFERSGCACLEYTPENALLSDQADDLDCPGMRPEECQQAEPGPSAQSAD